MRIFVESLLYEAGCLIVALIFVLTDPYNPRKYMLLTPFSSCGNRLTEVKQLDQGGANDYTKVSIQGCFTLHHIYCSLFLMLFVCCHHFQSNERNSSEAWKASFYPFFRSKRARTVPVQTVPQNWNGPVTCWKETFGSQKQWQQEEKQGTPFFGTQTRTEECLINRKYWFLPFCLSSFILFLGFRDHNPLSLQPKSKHVPSYQGCRREGAFSLTFTGAPHSFL